MTDDVESVREYIEETISTFEHAGEERVFNETMLKRPVGSLEFTEPVIVEPQTTALEAINLMRDAKVGCVLVVRGKKLKGIFTERDVLMRIVGKGVDAAKEPVRKAMTSNPEVLRATDSIAYALNLMSVGGYRHVPLIDNSFAPVGAVSMKDVVNYLVSYFPKSVMNLPTLPRGNYTREREGA